MNFIIRCFALFSFFLLAQGAPVSPRFEFLQINQAALCHGTQFSRNTAYEVMNAGFNVIRNSKNGKGPRTYEWPKALPDWQSLYKSEVLMFPILVNGQKYVNGQDPGPFRVVFSRNNIVNIIEVTANAPFAYRSCEVITQNAYDLFQGSY